MGLPQHREFPVDYPSEIDRVFREARRFVIYAQHLEIQQQRIAQIENGKLTPSANQLARLAAVLKIPPDQLLQPVEVLSVEATALVKVGRLRLKVARLEEEAAQ